MAGGLLHRGDLEHDFVDIAPEPVLAGLVRLDDGVAGVVRVFGGVPVRAVVAAADVPTDCAATQMHPLAAAGHALDAAGAARRHGADFIDV